MCQPEALIAFHPGKHRPRCTACGDSAEPGDLKHTCGATFTGIIVVPEEAAHARSMRRMRPDLAFVGLGTLVVTSNGPRIIMAEDQQP